MMMKGIFRTVDESRSQYHRTRLFSFFGTIKETFHSSIRLKDEAFYLARDKFLYPTFALSLLTL